MDRRRARELPVRYKLVFLLAVIIVATTSLGLHSDCDGHGAPIVLPVATTGGGGGGGGGGSTPTAVPTLTFYQLRGSQYSYDEGCGFGSEIDPVTTILLNAGSLEDHLRHINWDRDSPAPVFGPETRQRFYDNGVCVWGETSLGTNDGTQNCGDPSGTIPFLCPQQRWHTRCNAVAERDMSGRVWGTCTPHWDEAISSQQSCWHAVPPVYDGDDNYEGDGFTVGRDRLWWNLIVDDGHYFVKAEFWNNTRKMRQCNGDWTGSNGWVNFIDLGDYE